MVWTPPVRLLRSDTRAPANSIANTVASSANHPCGIFGLSARPRLCQWSLVIGKALSDGVAHKPPASSTQAGILGDANSFVVSAFPPLLDSHNKLEANSKFSTLHALAVNHARERLDAFLGGGNYHMLP